MCFTQRGPNAGAKPRKIKAKRCGPEGWWVRGRGRGGGSSRGNSVGCRQILSQLVEVKGLQSIVKKLLLSFWKVKHCKGGRGGGFDGRRPKSSNKHKQQQKQRQQHATTGTQATRKQQQNQEQHKQHKQQPRKSEGQEVWVPKVGGASSRGFRLCSRLFF